MCQRREIHNISLDEQGLHRSGGGGMVEGNDLRGGGRQRGGRGRGERLIKDLKRRVSRGACTCVKMGNDRLEPRLLLLLLLLLLRS